MAERTPTRRAASAVLTGLAVVVLWAVLVAPDRLDLVTPTALLRIPVEGILLVGLFALLPPRAGRRLAVAAGAVLGLLSIVRGLDWALATATGRSFNLATDWMYVGSAVSLARDAYGRPASVAGSVAAVVLAAALVVGMPLATRRVAGAVRRRRRVWLVAAAVAAVGWAGSAAAGLDVAGPLPVASSGTAGLAVDHAQAARAGILDREVFARQASVDAYALTPAADLLTGLRGKDVLVVFVESYGKVAVDGSAVSDHVTPTLTEGTRTLDAAGYSSRSAFLTSPTFGGISWLAHSTLQSGLWIDTQRRYDDLVESDRLTLSTLFARAGWRTVSDVPSDTKDWAPGRAFYKYDTLYDSRNVGYAGPRFGYALMPDQFTLSAFERNELAPTDRRPVMAEIDLVSSHAPWAPLPHLVDWSVVGDGSVFDPMPAQGGTSDLRDADGVRAAYGQSVAYSMATVVSFLQQTRDPNLVVLVLGDHQPAAVVSGKGAGHDVPVTLIARDPAVAARVSGWGWDPGLLPAPDAPVWPMDTFRDRFLTAFGSEP